MNVQQRVLLAIAVVALSVLSGCWTCSLNSLYSDDDPQLTYEPALEGAWKTGHDDTRLIITGDPKSMEYTLRLVDENESENESDADHRSEVAYKGRLVQLGVERFLDVVPEGDDVPGTIVAHNIFKVALQDDAFFFFLLNLDQLCRGPEAEGAILGQCINGDFIITASTDVLQDFVGDHSDDEAVFPTMEDDDIFRRAAKPWSAE